MSLTDFGTINRNVLRTLPRYIPPKNRDISKHMGCGCFLDAPGYPTYFLRSIYNRAGNDPRTGPTQVIDYEGKYYVTQHNDDWAKYGDRDGVHGAHTRLMRRLWNPLIPDHARVYAWMTCVAGYFKNCYLDPTLDADKVKHADKTFIPSHRRIADVKHYWEIAKIAGVVDVIPMWDHLPRAWKVIPGVDVVRALERVLVPRAVDYIHEFYPEIRPDYIASVPKLYGLAGNWWERGNWDHWPVDDCPRCRGDVGVGHKCDYCGKVGQDESGNICTAASS